MSDLLKPKEAAEALGGLAPQTLAVWRAKGFGPRYVKIGVLVRYPRSEIDAWLEERTSGRSKTSAAGGRKSATAARITIDARKAALTRQ
jgi:predicted DNA-binding transcriptional regulator AlpA